MAMIKLTLDTLDDSSILISALNSNGETVARVTAQKDAHVLMGIAIRGLLESRADQ